MNRIEHRKEALAECILDFLRLETPEAQKPPVLFSPPPSPKEGHLSVPCFQFAKPLRKPPAVIAGEVAAGLSLPDGFASAEAVGPYLNFRFRSDWLFEAVREGLRSPDFFTNDALAGETVMVEFSSPNANKPLHLGHARNNMLGWCLSNLLEKSSAKVIRVNLINDRGIHVCQSMLAYRKFGRGETPSSSGIKGDRLVGDYYVTYAKNLDASLAEEASAMLRDWEKGDETVRKLWRTMTDWVLEGFEATYRRMGVGFDRYYYESETYRGGRERVEKALEEGVCEREENGAVSIDLSDRGLDRKILLRSDGTSVYITQDIYTTIRKFEDYPLTGSIFVVGNEQDRHFRTLFAVLEKFGYGWARRCRHLSYGMIELPDGKMKSREGKVVDLDGLMDELKEKALDRLTARENSQTEKRSPETLATVAEQVGQAALKFYILRTTASKNMLFQPEESLAFEGNTGPYLQYTHARIRSIFAKSGHDFEADSPADDESPSVRDWSEDETSLLVAVAGATEAVRKAAEEMNPAILAHYLYDLAKRFNRFYAETPILKAPTAGDRAVRIELAELCMKTLAECMSMMGIHPLERM